jgi:lipid A 3-O-deacylase
MKLPTLFLITLLAAPLLRAGESKSTGGPAELSSWQDRVASQWGVDFETSALWRISDNTFLNYTVLPQALSIRTPANYQVKLENGSQWLLRSKLSLLAEAIVEGPESQYLGWSCSPSIEYWWSEKTYFHFSVGGGFGLIDSQGVPGGQGQDFTYNWFSSAGVRHTFGNGWTVGAGLMFQHFSNRGATDPNPGLDALGPMLGISRLF